MSTTVLEPLVAERGRLAAYAGRRGGYAVHPLRLVHELQQFLGGDVTVCLDVGSFYLWVAQHLYSFRPLMKQEDSDNHRLFEMLNEDRIH